MINVCRDCRETVLIENGYARKLFMSFPENFSIVLEQGAKKYEAGNKRNACVFSSVLNCITELKTNSTHFVCFQI